MISTSYPTRYHGILFRSRLEARWAAFFDLLDWPYAYEPIDLKTYIPDFFLLFPDPLLVEVKPALTLTELEQHTAKIDASGWKGEALLVGATLFENCPCSGDIPLLGLAREIGYPEEPGWCWTEAALIRCDGLSVEEVRAGNATRDHWGFNSTEQSFHCRACGKHRGDKGFTWARRKDGIFDLWAEAGNRTQWHPDGKENPDGLATQEPKPEALSTPNKSNK